MQINEKVPYRPIGDYAIIGDMHTAALIGTNGSLDWCCFPCFDSPAVFCKLLDHEKGGEFRIEPYGKYTCLRSYVGATNVLSLMFSATNGQFRVTDFMPLRHPRDDRHGETAAGPRIVRRIEGISGACEVEVVFRPTFDFARVETRIDMQPGRLLAYSDDEALSLESALPFELLASNHAYARVTIKAGQRLDLYLCDGKHARANDRAKPDIEQLHSVTLEFWKSWADKCTYQGPYRDLVQRSAMVLKLLTYAPSGAVIAAPTTSLPEELGGGRNWDYRYTWIRDSSLILEALMATGYHEEAMLFFAWIQSLCIRCCRDLQIMYTINGKSDLPELTLPHLEGYQQSSPVRVGNAAAKQKQLDIYGELLQAVQICYESMPAMRPPDEELWTTLRFIANEAANHWHETDDGIWEARGAPKHYLYSKLQCWVAMDRAIKLAEKTGLHTDIPRWEQTRDDIRDAILTKGYDEELGAFTQAFGVKALDASALTVPLTGFLPADDFRVRSTMHKIQEQLGAKGLVYRYLTEDGVSGGEAAFALCSFWMVDNLALTGDLAKARELFDQIVSYGNDVGLFAEELDPASGQMLGNFPQGFTHLALIRSAVRLAMLEKDR